MKQKLKDLALLLKEDRRAKFGLIVVVLAALFLMLAPGPKGPSQKAKLAAARKEKKEQATQTSASTEAYQDLISGFKGELDELKTQTSSITKSLDDQKKSMAEYEERTAAIFRKLIERMSETETTSTQNARGTQRGQQGAYPEPISVDGTSGMPGVGTDIPADEGLESFGNETVEAAPPPPPPPAKIAYIGAGDSVRVKLLAGVNAPTDGTPYPVVFSLDGNVSGPDGSALPLGEARLVAAAQGSLTDARALFRLTDLSIRLPNGRRKVYKVDGWVVGEDGIRGMQGILIDPIGKAIGGGILTGAVEGYGKALKDSQMEIRDDYRGTSQIVTGDIGKYALGSGIAGGSKEWSSIVKDRLNQMVPQVQVLSGREATAIFSKSISVDGLFEALDEEETSPSSLD